MTHQKSERGVALVYVAVFMVVILAFTAVGIDIARLAHVATEVQSVADIGARAGAKKLLDVGGTPGQGITQAKAVASLNGNVMDGVNVKPADVIVDEGHWNVETQKFECCNTNTPCCKDGTWGGTKCVGSSSCTHVTGVLAQPKTEVTNLFAGVFNYIAEGRVASAAVTNGNEKSQVQKLAIADASGPGAGCQAPPGSGCAANDWGCFCDHGVAPCLPITMPSCEFVPPNCNGVGCTLPAAQVSSNGNDTAAWTGFQSGHSENTVRGFISPLGSSACNPPGTGSISAQTDGSSVDVTNGISCNANNKSCSWFLVKCVAGCNAAGTQCPGSGGASPPLGCKLDANGNIIPGQRGNVFTIPIVDMGATCGTNFVGNQPIVGFATVAINSVTVPGNPRTINFQVVKNTTATQTQGGGLCLGTDCRVTMMQ